MHCGPLMVDADKMSKSLGNFRTIRQTIANADDLSDDVARYRVNPREAEMLRFFIVRNHYRSEEHTSELQSLMRISYAVFCLKKKNNTIHLTEVTSHNLI